MKLDEFMNQAWADHATNSADVGLRLNDAFTLLESNDQIPGLANLAAHVYGEHLGQWDKGVAYLRQLRGTAQFTAGTESEKAIARLAAALELAAGRDLQMTAFNVSDRVRIFAVAAAALAGQMKTQEAQRLFRQALELAPGLAKDDPANRALAVTGNNLAAALEEKPTRTAEEKDLMILAALTGRKFWELAGGWNQVFWAEYRLANAYLKADDLAHALEHAQTGLEVAEVNAAGAMERFYGYEILAHAERARGNSLGFGMAVLKAKEHFGKMSSEDKSWCESSLRKLE